MSDNLDLDGVTVEPGLSDTEAKLANELQNDFAELRSTIVDDVVQSTREDLKAAMKPNRTRLAQIAPKGDATEERKLNPSVRISPREEMRYRLLSEREREFRNPYDDHYIAMWLRGMATQSQGGGRLMREAHDKLEVKYGRADLLEGAPDADSGLGDGTGAHLLPAAVLQFDRSRT